MKNKTVYILISIFAILTCGYFFLFKSNSNPNPDFQIGQVVDSLNGVYVYFNGNVSNSDGKNIAPNSYIFGKKYRSNEFVNRYYFNIFNHKMEGASNLEPREYFDKKIPDGEINPKLNLLQFTNPSFSMPLVGDILVLDKSDDLPDGHLAIVSNVYDGAFEVTQQNAGPFANTRALFGCGDYGNKYKVDNGKVLGWLRLSESISNEPK